MTLEQYNANRNCKPVGINGGITGGFMYQNPCTGEMVNQDGSTLNFQPNSTTNRNRTSVNTNTSPSNVLNYLGLGLLVGNEPCWLYGI